MAHAGRETMEVDPWSSGTKARFGTVGKITASLSGGHVKVEQHYTDGVSGVFKELAEGLGNKPPEHIGTLSPHQLLEIAKGKTLDIPPKLAFVARAYLEKIGYKA